MSILNLVKDQLTKEAISQIGGKLNLDQSTTSTAVSAALPLLIQALSKNSANGQADAITQAVESKHDGSILDNISDYFQSDNQSSGQSILKHILGGQTSSIANSLGQVSGVDSNGATQILATLAPVIMGAIGKQKAENNLSSNDINDLLQNDANEISNKDSGISGFIQKALDSDNDGEISDDLTSLGASFLTNFLK